jgi:hypothetical protein
MEPRVYVLLSEGSEGADVEVFGAPDGDADIIRFDYYYFSKNADASETLEYLGNKLAELVENAETWPPALHDAVLGQVRAGVEYMRGTWHVPPVIDWDHLDWTNQEATRR